MYWLVCSCLTFMWAFTRGQELIIAAGLFAVAAAIQRKDQ